MLDYDAIIVGAGPAGSTLARHLKRQQKRVLLLDKSDFPRHKVCAGWVTPAVLDSLAFDRQAYVDSGRVLQPIHGFRVGAMGQKGAAWREPGGVLSYGIRRYEFDDWLQQQADVDKQYNVKVKRIDRQGDSWCVNERWRAPLLIGAGGHFCPVASYLGDGPGGHERIVAAKELEAKMSAAEQAVCQVAEDQPQLWFCRDLKGYAWVFRKGDYINIGLGREDNQHLNDHLGAFVGTLEKQGVIPAIEGHYKGHAYLLYDRARRPLLRDGVLLVGDAAGLAYTQSGEGIRPAIESALLAAEALAEAKGYSAAELTCYQDKMQVRFGKRLQTPSAAGDNSRLKVWLAAALMRTQWFTRQVVVKRWFLHQQLPALMEGSD